MQHGRQQLHFLRRDPRDMDVDCTGPTAISPTAPSASSPPRTRRSPGVRTNIGWDFATGIGTVNAANLVNMWPASARPSFSLLCFSGRCKRRSRKLCHVTRGCGAQNGLHRECHVRRRFGLTCRCTPVLWRHSTCSCRVFLERRLHRPEKQRAKTGVLGRGWPIVTRFAALTVPMPVASPNRCGAVRRAERRVRVERTPTEPSGEIAVWTGAIHVHIAEGHVVENAAVASVLPFESRSSAAAGTKFRSS